jgi:malate dehydrogenase
MERLDQNRAKTQLAKKAGVAVSEVTNLAVWGNHSPTMYPDVFNAKVSGGPAWDAIGQDRAWLENEFIPKVGKRGAEIIEARGASSAASAANAAVDHVRDWVRGTPEGDWASMSVASDGSYGVPEGLVSSFPCTCSGGDWKIVEGLEIDDFSRQRIDATAQELEEEREAVEKLGLI